MTGITHKQAGRYMRADLDGLLTNTQRRELTTHLDECEACRLESESFSLLTARLKNDFRARWDTQHGPSTNVMANIQSQSRRIIMSNRIGFVFRTFASTAALTALGLFLIYGIKNFINTNPHPATTSSSNSSASGVSHGDLIAFVSEQDGNKEIYITKSDGSGLTNLTNNSASDTFPVWSPDGSHIAFVSERDGNDNIYVMNFDGSNVTRLTDAPVIDADPLWSSDGTKIAYASGSYSHPININIYVVDVNGQNRRRLTNYDPNTTVFPSFWSSDNQAIIFQVNGQMVQVSVNGGDVTPFMPQTDKHAPLIGVLSKDNSILSYLVLCDDMDSSSFCYMLMSAQRNDSNVKTINTFKTQLCENKQSAGWMGSYAKWSPDRTRILFAFTCEDNGWLYIANADGSDFKPLTNHPILGDMPENEMAMLDWSPDSQSVVFMSALDKPGNLYTLNINDALNDPSITPTRLTNSTALVSYPAWQPIVNNDIVEENPTPEPTQPEGLIAYVNNTNGDAEIYIMQADGSNPTNLTNHSGQDVNPIWSSDGRHILFESDRTGFNQIYIMNVDGSNLTQLTDEKADHAIGTKYGNTPEPWSPDGKKIVYSQRFSKEDTNLLYVMDSDGSNKIALTSEPGMYTFLSWSPDGKKIVYQDQQFEGRIRIVDNNGTNYIDGPFFEGDKSRRYSQIHWETPEQFIALGSNNEQTTWGPWNITRFFTTGDYTKYNGSNPILVTSNSPIVAIFDKTYVVEDQNSLTWFAYDGAPIPLSPWDFSTLCNSTDPLVEETFHFLSPDKQHDFVDLLCPEGNSYFFLMTTNGTEIHQVGKALAQPLQVNAMEWSPDGKYVIATILNINNESTELYRFDIQEMLKNSSTPQTQLTVDGAMKYGAVWQPIVNNDIVEEKPTPETPQTDNQMLAFTSNQDGNLDIYTMHADGSGLTNLTNNPARDINPFWSPDGKRIAFESARTGFMQIYLMDADGPNVVQLTDDNAVHALGGQNNSNSNLWSPDGSKLIFSEQQSNAEQWMLYVMDMDTKQKTLLFNQPAVFWNPSWSPDGKYIAFIENDSENQTPKLYVTDSNGSNLTEITKSLPGDEALGGYLAPDFYWSQDGQSIFFIASNMDYIAKNGLGGDNNNVYNWKAYEVSLDGSTLTLNATTHSPIGGWWQGDYFITPLIGTQSWTWVHAKGVTTVNPYRNCEGSSGGGSRYQQSSNGNVVIGAMCPNFDWWLYWVNSKGSMLRLIDSPIPTSQGDMQNLAWSQDDKFVAFDITATGKTDMYIVNVSESKNDPSIQPVKISLGDGSLNFNMSWQPKP